MRMPIIQNYSSPPHVTLPFFHIDT